MEGKIDYEAGISNIGNVSDIRQLMYRAACGEPVTIAFLGGSITQGSLASRPENCYAARVIAWWKQTFPKADITYLNAGIGGTTSQFGCARVQHDVLEQEPDLVIVEFSVNDESTSFYLETYEGLIRKILSYQKQPAVMAVHNVRYDNGANAQIQHGKIARHYQIPAVSMQSSIYPQVVNGSISGPDITPDDLHPNDYGHKLVADVIIYDMKKILADDETDAGISSNKHRLESDRQRTKKKALPAPLTCNKYEAAVRYQAMQPAASDSDMIRQISVKGFLKDETSQSGLTDVFKHGWVAREPGAAIVFEIEASEIAVQYRKSVKKPALSARVVLDGRQSESVLLDGNFEQDWGDCLYIDTLLYHGDCKKHTIEITTIQTDQEAVIPFYLASVIASK